MNNVYLKHPASIIKIVCVVLFLLVDSGCTDGSQTITGKVVDEYGVALSYVAVTACYSGWGWSAGQLVWDKDFCSEPVSTNSAGLYVINFEGPGSMRLRARKEGWIQTQDFNSTDSHIILTKGEDHGARLKSEAKLREQDRRQRLPGESGTEYYCRVILPRNRPVNLSYQDEILSITPILLKHDDLSEALFALRGSDKATSSFTTEVMLRVNGETLSSNFSFRSVVTNCDPDIHFIAVNITGLYLGAEERIEFFIPGIRAMFDMQFWSHLENL